MKNNLVVVLIIFSSLLLTGFKCQPEGLSGIIEEGPFPGARVLEQNPQPGSDYPEEAFDNAQPWETYRRFVRTDQVGWLYSWGGRHQDWAECVVSDDDGNIYVGAKYSGTIDLNPGTGIDEHRHNDCELIIIKFGPDGEYIWGKELMTDIAWQGYIHDMVIDRDGDLFVLTTSINSIYRLNKMTQDGEILWHINLEPKGNVDDKVEMIADVEGNIYVAGTLRDRLDFDPGPEEDLQGINNNIEQAFITSYDGLGDYRWTRSWVTGERQPVNGLAVDSFANVILLGTFKETVDFDFGPGSTELYSERWADSFMVKLGSDGSFIWATKLNPETAYIGRDVIVDDKDNIYVTGEYTPTIESPDGWLSTRNIFINGYSPQRVQISESTLYSDGTIFVKKIRQGSDGNFVIAGFYKEAQAIRDNETTYHLEPEFQWNYFLINLDQADSIDWMRVWGNSEWEEWNPHPTLDLTITNDESILVCGEFKGYVDFDSTDHDVVRNSGWNGEEWYEDGFLMKLSPEGNFFEGERDLSAEVVADYEFSPPSAPNYTHRLMGVWDVEIDPDTLTANIDEDMDAFDRFNIPDSDRPPSNENILELELNSYDPQTRVLTCEISLVNPFPDSQAYCGRLVIGSNEEQEFSGIDGFTPLWEEDLEEVANSYYGFPQPSNSDPYPFFNSGEKYTRQFEIQNVNPGEPFSFRFAADLSANGPPLEPVMLADFEFEGYFTGEGSECYYVSSTVIDPQGDDKEVLIIQMPFASYCGQATSSPFEEKFILCNDNNTSPGEYQIVLRAISDDAPDLPAYQVATLVLEGDHGPEPEATFTYMTAQHAWHPGDVISFDAGDSGHYIVKYHWDWGDGQTEENVNDRATHYYERTGTFDVTLVTQIADVLSGPFTRTIQIVEGYEITDITPYGWNFEPQDIALAGNTACVAAGVAGLLLFDISETNNPLLVATVDLPGEAVKVEASGNLAFVACVAGGFQVVDIRNPREPSVIFKYEQHNLDINCVEVYQDKVFIGGGAFTENFFGERRVESDDLLDNLQEIIYAPEHNFSYMAVTGGTMTTYRDSQPYLHLHGDGTGTIIVTNKYYEHIADIILQADGTFSIREAAGEIIDSDYMRSIPSLFSNEDYDEPESTPGTGETIASLDRTPAMVKPGLVIGFDFSDSDNPELVSEIVTNNEPVSSMDIYGDYLYFHESFENPIHKVNLAEDPSVVESTIRVPNYASSEPFIFTVHDGYAYFDVALQGSFALGVDEPATIGELKEIPSYWGSGFEIQEQYAFFCGRGAGLVIMDVSDLDNIQPVASIEGAYPSAIIPLGNILYAVNSGSLRIFDLSDMENPVTIGSYNTIGQPATVILNGDYIYIPDNSSGWHIINNSDPDNPLMEKVIDIPVGNDFVQEGNYIYSNGYRGFTIVDTSDPANPSIVSTYNQHDNSTAITYDDGYVYSVYSMRSDEGITVFDVSDRSAPVEVMQIPIPGKCYDVEIYRGHAYVANDEEGFTVVDISPLGSAHIVETIELNDRPTDVELYEDFAFVTGQDKMFTIYRIDSPGECVLVRELILTHRVNDIYIRDGLAYLPGNTGDVPVLDLSLPSYAHLIEPLQTNLMVISIVMKDGYGYVTTNDSTFHILDLP